MIGDAPVLAFSGQQVGWHGLVPKGAVVFLPLSTHAVLVGEPDVFGRSVAPDRLVEVVNGLTTREAYDAVFRHPGMAWPAGLRYGPQPHRLPEPTVTLSRSDPGTASTFPYRYPEMDEEQTAALLRHLGAAEVVE